MVLRSFNGMPNISRMAAVQYLTAPLPLFLLFDGHHSDISLHLIYTAKESNIIIFCLPPNCTHVLQFLDVRRWRQGQFTYQRVLSRVNIKALGCSYKAITCHWTIERKWNLSSQQGLSS